MLKDTLYHIKRYLTENDRFEAGIVLASDHWILQAHFPEYPVVPGAALVQTAAELTPGDGTVLDLRSVKFLQMVRPGEELQINGQRNNGWWKVAFFRQEQCCCKMEYTYG
ncbi:MAG: hypothetical protein J6Z12_03095 [Paludibacteraceae bacterium]|nr:hypothetical protein [Paludibacteraceae bacterium]